MDKEFNVVAALDDLEKRIDLLLTKEEPVDKNGDAIVFLSRPLWQTRDNFPLTWDRLIKIANYEFSELQAKARDLSGDDKPAFDKTYKSVEALEQAVGVSTPKKGYESLLRANEYNDPY